MRELITRASLVAATGAAAGGIVYSMVVRGALTVDVGVGRRIQPLGPLTRAIKAPRDTVFDVIAAPYLGRTPRALADEIDVLERGSDMVLAAHRTPAGLGLVATTVETVRFQPPERISFRLLRGPVPSVVETFVLADEAGSTRLDYSGELGTDFVAIGKWWGAQVARKWVATVDASMTRIADESERRANARSRHR